MNRTSAFYRLKSTTSLQHLCLTLLLLCGFTSWIGSDFHSADATVSAVYLTDANELVAANNSDSLRVRPGVRKSDLSDKSDSDNEIEPIWLLHPANSTDFTAPSSTNHNYLSAISPRGTDKYLLKAPRAPPLA
jgi:hypothetical protein